MPVEQRRTSQHGGAPGGRHGHGHGTSKTPTSSSQSNRRRSSSNLSGAKLSAKTKMKEHPSPQPTPEPEIINKPDVDPNEEENVDVLHTDPITNGTLNEVNEIDEVSRENSVDNEPKIEIEEEKPKSFNDNIIEFTEIFESDRFQKVDQDYPVEDLISIVTAISHTIEEFKQQTLSSQNQLEGLRMKMREVKENIHSTVTKTSMQFPNGKFVSIYCRSWLNRHSSCSTNAYKMDN